ncbi:hypothetical protein CCP3SC15_1170003 [Gammaproteobacteria bacterium]
MKEPIQQIDGDGAYDTHEVYEVAAERETTLVVPPRENAVPWEENHPRTRVLADIEVKKEGSSGKRIQATTSAVSRSMPCTDSNNCLAVRCLRVISMPRQGKSMPGLRP